MAASETHERLRTAGIPDHYETLLLRTLTLEVVRDHVNQSVHEPSQPAEIAKTLLKIHFEAATKDPLTLYLARQHKLGEHAADMEAALYKSTHDKVRAQVTRHLAKLGRDGMISSKPIQNQHGAGRKGDAHEYWRKI